MVSREEKGMFAVLWVIMGLGIQFGNFALQASSAYFTQKTDYKPRKLQVSHSGLE